MARHVDRPLLAEDDRRALERLRATAPKAYLRERAAALLKVADGMSPMHVARSGLLRRRTHEAV
ncbi:MAG: hypothetical protein HY689_12140 [Chloroflexi bacterium]|nr:hypothetical protein [Chloroflexota bacterium]